MNKHAELYLLSTFQTSDIAPKPKFIHLTKSPKPNDIYNLC